MSDFDDLEDFLVRRGYRPCDIPACNCGSYHGGHAEERLHEIYDALGGCNGTTPLLEIADMIKLLRQALLFGCDDDWQHRANEMVCKVVEDND